MGREDNYNSEWHEEEKVVNKNSPEKKRWINVESADNEDSIIDRIDNPLPKPQKVKFWEKVEGGKIVPLSQYDDYDPPQNGLDHSFENTSAKDLREDTLQDSIMTTAEKKEKIKAEEDEFRQRKQESYGTKRNENLNTLPDAKKERRLRGRIKEIRDRLLGMDR